MLEQYIETYGHWTVLMGTSLEGGTCHQSGVIAASSLAISAATSFCFIWGVGKAISCYARTRPGSGGSRMWNGSWIVATTGFWCRYDFLRSSRRHPLYGWNAFGDGSGFPHSEHLGPLPDRHDYPVLRNPWARPLSVVPSIRLTRSHSGSSASIFCFRESRWIWRKESGSM